MTDEMQNGAMPTDENQQAAGVENQTTEGEVKPEEKKEEATSTEEAK